MQRRALIFIYFNWNTMKINLMVTGITWLLPSLTHTQFAIISKGSSTYAKSSCKGILSLVSLRLYLSILFLLTQGQFSKQLILNISIKSIFFLWGSLINHISFIYLTTLCSILFVQLLQKSRKQMDCTSSIQEQVFWSRGCIFYNTGHSSLYKVLCTWWWLSLIENIS